MMTLLSSSKPLLLLLLLLILATAAHAKEDRVPTNCKELNKFYDDDTVYCDEDTNSFDLDYLDPENAPWRCQESWDVSQVQLEPLDPLYVCIQWHTLYGLLKPALSPTEAPTNAPIMTIAPTQMPTMTATTLAPTEPPVVVSDTTPSPVVTATPTMATPTPDDNETNNGTIPTNTNTDSIPLEEFTLRIVVPSHVTTSRRRGLGRQLQADGISSDNSNGNTDLAPYNQEELVQITNEHIASYLETELHRNVHKVDLRIVDSTVSELERTTSTVTTERMTGSVYFETTSTLSESSSSSSTTNDASTTPSALQVPPSQRTINALAIQAFEGQAMWEFFFRLRGANDAYLQKTQEVTLVDDGNGAAFQSSSNGTFSAGVIATLVVIGIVTAAIVGYFVVWLKRQNHDLAIANEEAGNSGERKKSTDTPDTQTSDQFFPEDEEGDGAEGRPKRSRRRRGQHRNKKSPSPSSSTSQGGRGATSTRLNDEVMSTGSVSFVSSALHSIRERSWEDEEEEPEDVDDKDDDERVEPEPPSRDRLWGDDSESEIDVQTELLENTPPLNYKPDDGTAAMEGDYGEIHRIMSLETSYSTIHGTEVTRREVEVPTAAKKPAEKPANRWSMWKSSTRRAQKKQAAANHRAVAEQQRRPPVQPPVEVDTSLDPPSMVDVSFDPPSLDPPSQMDIEAGDLSLEGESINVSEF